MHAKHPNRLGRRRERTSPGMAKAYPHRRAARRPRAAEGRTERQPAAAVEELVAAPSKAGDRPVLSTWPMPRRKASSGDGGSIAAEVSCPAVVADSA